MSLKNEVIYTIKKELYLLREKVDPLNIRKLEVLSGSERKELLDEIIQKELAKQKKYPNL